MSYEKVIGFGLDPKNPKAEPRGGVPHEHELSMFKKMGVPPVFYGRKKYMPDNGEPEPKLFVKSSSDFELGRRLIANASNAFLIPGQNYEEKHPLTSLLIDDGAGTLDQQDVTMRYRFEFNPQTGLWAQGDYNEKTGMKNSAIIGGCADRFEREREQEHGEDYEQAYNNFLRDQRAKNDPTFSDKIPFKDMLLSAGYQCARNEMGVAFKHPKDDVMFVFEICEDFWHDIEPNMQNEYHEWEFEVKQVWGELPKNVQTKEQFKEYVYGAMTMFQQHFHANIPGSLINMKSKAEITKENLQSYHGLTAPLLEAMGLKSTFAYANMIGGAQQLSAAMHDPATQSAIYRMGMKLHDKKTAFNAASLIKPSPSDIGFGSGLIIPPYNDNARHPAPRIAV